MKNVIVTPCSLIEIYLSRKDNKQNSLTFLIRTRVAFFPLEDKHCKRFQTLTSVTMKSQAYFLPGHDAVFYGRNNGMCLCCIGNYIDIRQLEFKVKNI